MWIYLISHLIYKQVMIDYITYGNGYLQPTSDYYKIERPENPTAMTICWDPSTPATGDHTLPNKDNCDSLSNILTHLSDHYPVVATFKFPNHWGNHRESYNDSTTDVSLYTLFPKRNATLISRFFMVTLDQCQWPRVMCTMGNGVFDTLLQGAMYKWNLAQSSLIYTPPQRVY